MNPKRLVIPSGAQPFLRKGWAESRDLLVSSPAGSSPAENHAGLGASLGSAGQRFSADNKDGARSASSEGSQGNPSRACPEAEGRRVPPSASTRDTPYPRPPASHESRVTGHGSLDGAWIEIFRAGDYGTRGRWTPDDLDHLAATYNPRLHPAPVVLGHPADDAPAYGWVRCLRRAGASLWAQLEKVDPLLEALLRAGRFAQRSVALYTRFPLTGGPYLRHVGFLGAAPAAVKALAPVRFAGADAATVFFSLDLETAPIPSTASLPEEPMPDSKSRLEALFDHLRNFFTTDTPAHNDDAAAASPETSTPADPAPQPGPAFADRLQQLEQRLDALFNEKHSTEEKLTQAEVARQQAAIANFVESLRARGRFPPAFDLWGVQTFMERLVAADATLQSTLSFRALACPGGEESAFQTPAASAPLPPAADSEPQSDERSTLALPVPPALSVVEGSEAEGLHEARNTPLLAWFQDFLTRLPAVIEFGELASASEATRRSLGVGGPRTIRFTEPRRGVTIDPASVELAERAEALAAQAGISYAEALTGFARKPAAHRHAPDANFTANADFHCHPERSEGSHARRNIGGNTNAHRRRNRSHPESRGRLD